MFIRHSEGIFASFTAETFPRYIGGISRVEICLAIGAAVLEQFRAVGVGWAADNVVLRLWAKCTSRTASIKWNGRSTAIRFGDQARAIPAQCKADNVRHHRISEDE
jgi:hypothetical protein